MTNIPILVYYYSMEYEVVLLKEVRNFLDTLELKLKAKSYRTINLLSIFGPILTLPHRRKITGTKDLYELRVQQANNICRLFYFYYEKQIYVILSGFVKKRDKTDKGEIEKALRIREIFLKEKKL